MTAQHLRDVLALSKPRITALVVCTMAGGLWVAPAALELPAALLALAAVAMTVGAANTLNCWLERDVDRHMARTRDRPLPAGRLAPGVALGVGLALAAVSVPVLALVVNGLTAALGAVALVSYVLLYTPLKQKTPLALPIGAVPGALPPLMGWTAATGTLDAPGLVLFGILFFWQLPHFLAIGLYRKEDYAAAGLRIGPVVHGERATKIEMAVWSVALVVVTLLPYPLAMAGLGYLVTAVLLGAAFLAICFWGLRRDAGRRWARAVFLASLVYLTVLFPALMLDAR